MTHNLVTLFKAAVPTLFTAGLCLGLAFMAHQDPKVMITALARAEAMGMCAPEVTLRCVGEVE